MQQSIITRYQEKIQETKQQIKHLENVINRYSIGRLVLIVVGGGALFQIVQYENVWWTLVVILLVLLMFFLLVARQSKLTKSREDLLDDNAVVQNELDLIANKKGLYDMGVKFEQDQHPYSGDLDIFGNQSLYHKINRSATPLGESTLASWLSTAATVEVIKKRQEAIKELANDIEWCQHFQARLLFNLKKGQDYKSILANYLHKPIYNIGNRWLKGYVSYCPYLIGLCIAASFFVSLMAQVVITLIIINILLAMGFASKVSLIAGGIGKTGSVLQKFGRAFQCVEDRQWESMLIKEMRLAKNGTVHEPKFSESIAELGNIINRLDARLNVMIGTVLNGLFLWDFKQVDAINVWRLNHGSKVISAFDDVAQLEALMSLAVLYVNHERWTWPVILTGEKQHLVLKGMGHPLISSSSVVTNDYNPGGHRIALITGSNMAGKSTFLRTVGINMVLAFCGGPVYAEFCELTVMHVITYMRIKDSLKESTSTFKAELNRLEMVLKVTAREVHTFFLIDEMLRGTNSVDKYLGSKAVIETLIQRGAVGMVATHDLQLAALEEAHNGYLKNFHFDIQVVDGEMLFDYKLKEGACNIFNASILLKKIGLQIDV
ncbi:DNA mismatch repair protein MutS [Olivibacter sp. SDN3]|uniref:MutS-related protein n=1 Tax=Olivibacter sp. SDN3 TaxID=2764720 RepID=UPI0016518170|nr:DNA mismatch repair protein MutS [Olivibacter sp. SDN3]QNL50377.1 DNA mismatch repair protein MutS [Olivibacter sp. SDN3]